MKRLYSFIIVSILISTVSCNKEVSSTSSDVMTNMIANKTWYLDYSITGNITQNFVGQSTYFITYLKDGTTKDSDGIIGTYTINNNNGKYEIQVTAKTVNGNTTNYNHVIESVGNVKMVQSFIATGQTVKTTLYFTSK